MSSSPRKRFLTLGIIAIAAVVTVTVTAAVLVSGTRSPSGEIPESVLHADTRLGAVDLRVRDLPTMTAFYGPSGIGLSVLGETAGSVSLGIEDDVVIRLTTSDGDYASMHDAGLYHSAVLYPDGPALAEAMVRMANRYPALYQGSADHRVSEAFYFGDPEGNGVELYVDTPREDWVWEDGQVQMGSDPLDPNAFIQQHLGGETSGSVTMGHVHLKVGDIDQAREFYVDTLGFAVTAEANGALFMSAGGYHHHLAANAWASAGADARPAGLGLDVFAVVLPTASDVDGVAERIAEAGLPFEQDAGSLTVADPWGNQVRITAAG